MNLGGELRTIAVSRSVEPPKSTAFSTLLRTPIVTSGE
jgi:hypothetical protein